MIKKIYFLLVSIVIVFLGIRGILKVFHGECLLSRFGMTSCGPENYVPMVMVAAAGVYFSYIFGIDVFKSYRRK